MHVEVLPEAERELLAIPPAERYALQTALEKLELYGDRLPFPHSSSIRGSSLRELRPRAGRSPWRAFYARVRDRMVIGAVGPEAQVDPRGFRRATALAEERIIQWEKEPRP